MSTFNELIAIAISFAVGASSLLLEAKTRLGDRYLVEGRAHESRKEWDEAIKSYERALSEDPAEVVYQMATEKARFEGSGMHVLNGLNLRAQGQLVDALMEFQKAYSLSPGSAIADQEIQLTQEMITRESRHVHETGKESSASERALTPVERMKKEEMDKIDRILTIPELKPIDQAPLKLRISGQKTKTVFETITRYAGINVVWDPEYQPPQKDSINVDLENESIERALDIVSSETKSYWKPLSSNTIFITNDNPNKRRDYEDNVTKIFYLQNVSTPAELQEIVNIVRTAADLNRVFPYNAQFALVVRGEADRVELASKLIRDLDKPKSEVLVDILVLEASSTFSRQLTAAIASTGLNVPVTFAPRSSIQTSTSTSSTSSSSSSSSTSSTSSSTGSSYVSLANVGHLSSADFATTLPSALLQAAMSDARTRVLQAPQLRAVDNQKASLKIGEREPTASGSYQAGTGSTSVNALVNTQFTYLDVGVNVDMTPRVHDNNEVSMHITLEISTITGQVNLGGINEPVIGQRKVDCELRMKEGEVGLLGGLINQEDDTTVTGIPGLSSIPLLGKLFSGNSVNHNRDELMIVLIPHILRSPQITTENIRPIAVGSTTVIQLHHAPKEPELSAKPAPPEGTQGAETAPNPGTPQAAAQSPAPPLLPSLAPTQPGVPPGLPQGPPAGNGKVRFDPEAFQAATGATVTASLVIEDAVDVTAAPLRVVFDPKVLQLTSVTPGDFLAADGQQTVFANDVMNEAGQATIQFCRLPGRQGVTAPKGTLLTMNFQVISQGSTVVTVPNLAVSNSQGGAAATGSPKLTINMK